MQGQQYGLLRPFNIIRITEVPELITDSDDFINQFKGDKPVKFSQETKKSIIRFQQQHNQLFNELIILINDAK